MTDAQKTLFISIAQSGIACGLWHPFEWLINYQRALDSWCNPNFIAENETKASEAFLEFFNECDGCEGDSIKSWTVEEMNAAMTQYFETRRNEVDALRRIQEMAAEAKNTGMGSKDAVYHIEAAVRVALGIKI